MRGGSHPRGTSAKQVRAHLLGCQSRCGVQVCSPPCGYQHGGGGDDEDGRCHEKKCADIHRFDSKEHVGHEVCRWEGAHQADADSAQHLGCH